MDLVYINELRDSIKDSADPQVMTLGSIVREIVTSSTIRLELRLQENTIRASGGDLPDEYPVLLAELETRDKSLYAELNAKERLYSPSPRCGPLGSDIGLRR